MQIISSEGKDGILFVGEGLGEPSSPPFSTPAGSSVLRTGALNLGIFPHYIELRKDDHEDSEISEDIKQAIFNYIKKNNIEKVISLGKSTTVQLFPSITTRQSMTNLVNSPMVIPTEINVKVGVMYHPLGVYKSKDPDAISDWWGTLSNLLNHREQVTVHVNKINSEEEFIKLLEYLRSSKNTLSLDYETNGENPFHKDHYITTIGLGEAISPTEANAWYWTTYRSNISESAIAILGDFLEETAPRNWAYNVPFEMKVTWHLTGKYIKMQDAMVLATMYAKRSSLKNLVRQEFGAMIWESGVNDFIENSKSVFKIASKNDDVRIACLTGDIKTLLESPAKDNIEWMLENFNEDEIIEGLSHYPYHWGSVPKGMLGVYCARDAGYTTLLANKFYTPDMQLAYSIYIRHPWLAAKFEARGVPWDDLKASELKDSIEREMLDRLYAVIQKCDIPEEDKLTATDIYHRSLPYDIVWYTEKTKQERRRTVRTLGDKIEHLKNFFNPASNTSESRKKFWNSYNTNSIQLASVLLLTIQDMELQGKLEELYEQVGDKSFLYTNTPEVVMEKLIDLVQQNTKLSKFISRSLTKSTENLGEVTGKFSKEAIKFQYQVHTTFFGLKIEDESTWSPEFRMIFDIFLYKKYDKLRGTNIEGSTGRAAVYNSTESRGGVFLRKSNYFKRSNSDDFSFAILDTDFNSLAAATTRWTSGFHVIPAGSPARKCLTTPNNRSIWVHADYSQAELVTLAYFSQDPTMIQAFIDGMDMHRFVASKAFAKPYDEVTGPERRAAKAIGFGIIYGKSIENTAIEVTGGDVDKAQALFDAFFNAFPGIKVWMDEKKREVDQYCYVTTLFGNHIEIDVNQPGNAKYRQGVNAPIQGTASTVAGTSIFDFTEATEAKGIPTWPVGFTHDAMDDILLELDHLFEYIKLMIYELQTKLYQEIGMPMRIDYEIGVDSYNQCSFTIINEDDSSYKVEVEGTEEAINLLLERLSISNTYSINEIKELKSNTEYHSWGDMFTVGTALQDSWGKTITTKTLEVKFDKHG